MNDDETRPLTDHEQAYMAQVRLYLGDLAIRDRKALLAAIEQNLAERPPTGDFAELARQVGSPRDYADGLLADLDAAEQGSVERSRRRGRRRRVVVVVAILLLVAGGSAGVVLWQTWQASFTANTAGLCVGSEYPDRCDVASVTDHSNLFGNVQEIMCIPGTPVTVTNGLKSSSAVTVTGVDFGLSVEAGALLRLDDVEPWSLEQGDDEVWSYPGPGTWPLAIGPGDREVLLRFHLTLVCDHSWMSPGGSTTLEQFVVHYRAFGKDRQVWVPLQQALQITMPS